MAELGLVNATMHKTDECVAVADIERADRHLRGVARRLFREPASMNDAPIGIFDSGMGGLTVMRALVRAAAERALSLSRRHGAAALWHQERRHGEALCPAGRAGADGARREAGRHRLQHRIGFAAGAARSAGALAGDRRDRARRASSAEGCARAVPSR